MNLKYSLRIIISGTFGEFSSGLSSPGITLSDYQTLRSGDWIEEIEIDRTNGNVIENISLTELEQAALRENPSTIFLSGRKDLTSGLLFPMYD